MLITVTSNRGSGLGASWSLNMTYTSHNNWFVLFFWTYFLIYLFFNRPSKSSAVEHTIIFVCSVQKWHQRAPLSCRTTHISSTPLYQMFRLNKSVNSSYLRRVFTSILTSSFCRMSTEKTRQSTFMNKLLLCLRPLTITWHDSLHTHTHTHLYMWGHSLT